MTDQTTTDADSTPATKTGIAGIVARIFGRSGTIVPVVRLQGTIAAEQRPGRININAANPLLEKAFKIKRAPAVAIIINSPGGSPVQSRLVSKRIRELSKKHDKKVLVFIEDIAASGGYFIAVAGDEVFADPSSIVGSIGVIFSGFGFVEAIEKLGISRRVYTAGRSKSQLDPFLPEKKADVDRLKTFEDDIHQVFIDHVKSHRGDKLNGKDDALFTGEWWTATRGLELGLIDAIGDLHEVLAERYGDDVQLKHITPKRGLFQMPRLGIGAGQPSSALVGEAISTLEDRALWSRFGL